MKQKVLKDTGKSLDEYKKIGAGDEDVALFATPNSGGEVIFYKKDCGINLMGKIVLVKDFYICTK